DCLSPTPIAGTFYLLPGANYAWVGISCAGRSSAPTGTITIGSGSPVALSFGEVCVRNNLGGPTGIGNWYSQSVALPMGASKVVATITGAGSVKYCAVTTPS